MKTRKHKKPPTRQARLPTDLGEMLAVIAWHDGTTVSELVDPLIRPQVLSRFAAIPEPVREIALKRIAAKS